MDENVKTDLFIYDPVSIFDQIFLIAQIIFHGDPTFVFVYLFVKNEKKFGLQIKKSGHFEKRNQCHN